MIRKLKSGKYRLYSRKKDQRTGKRKNLGTFNSKLRRRNTNARFSISSGIRAVCSLQGCGFLTVTSAAKIREPSFLASNVCRLD